MTRRKLKRVGPKMRQALEVAYANPSCTKRHIAAQVGPHGSLKYGYQTVNRCIRQGLIFARLTPRGYELILSLKGYRVLHQQPRQIRPAG